MHTASGPGSNACCLVGSQRVIIVAVGLLSGFCWRNTTNAGYQSTVVGSRCGVFFLLVTHGEWVDGHVTNVVCNVCMKFV